MPKRLAAVRTVEGFDRVGAQGSVLPPADGFAPGDRRSPHAFGPDDDGLRVRPIPGGCVVAAPTLLRVSGLGSSRREGRRTVPVLRDVSLEVCASQLVAVLGPRGAGKTTLLRCLAGLHPLQAGQVEVAGSPVGSLPGSQLARVRREELGFLLRSGNLVPALTVAQNVELPWTVARRRAPEGAVARALGQLGLADLSDVRAARLSPLQEQQVALARVLAKRPRVVLADEPTGDLDPREGRVLLAELATMAHVPGRCVLVVTHDPAVAAACDRVVHLRDGMLAPAATRTGLDEVGVTGVAQEVGGHGAAARDEVPGRRRMVGDPAA